MNYRAPILRDLFFILFIYTIDYARDMFTQFNRADNLHSSTIMKNPIHQFFGTLHMNSDCIEDEETCLKIYGTEGIVSIGDPNLFGSTLTLHKPLSDPIEYTLLRVIPRPSFLSAYPPEARWR